MQLALMDCNNFYASCEKAFDPRLARVPVVVLSNNDGCIIARSGEAKELGVPMGAPEFKCREMFRRLGVAVLSSNYALYGDMSARVMATAGAMVPRMEVYSIDEAFLDLSGLPGGPERAAREIRRAVLRATGIPVSIGAGPTKTLAKAANKLAKKDASLGGVLVLPDGETGREEFLARVEVGDVWGIGPRHARRLRERGVLTALDFTRLPRDLVRKKMTVGGLHTWLELRGTPCIPLEMAPRPKKAIVSSRSFGRPVTALEEMREAVSQYAARAAEKLRAQKGLAASILVWVQTNTFIEGEPQYSGVTSLALCPPTAHSASIVSRGVEALESIFRAGYRYKKAGVMLSGIESEAGAQLSLLGEPDPRRDRLMQTLDRVNARWGRGTLFPAACGVERPWSMKQARRSPRYTTCWSELPVAYA
ncbi:MAG: Y-family DNA polymerase [Thermodesulfobacteriota bacterium]